MSQFSDAIMANLVGSLDPNKAMEKDYMSTVISVQKQEVIRIKSENIKSLATTMSELPEGTSSAVREAYESLLQQTLKA